MLSFISAAHISLLQVSDLETFCVIIGRIFIDRAHDRLVRPPTATLYLTAGFDGHCRCRAGDKGGITTTIKLAIKLKIIAAATTDSRVVASRISKQEGPGSIPGGGKEV